MSAPTPLTGTALVSCVKASAAHGFLEAASQCGYADRLDEFEQALAKACEEMGIETGDLKNLFLKQEASPESGVEISPDSINQL